MLSAYILPRAHDPVPEETCVLNQAAPLWPPAVLAGELPTEANNGPWPKRLDDTLAHNIATGRYARACRYATDEPLSLVAYARRVAAELVRDWEQVEALRRGDGPAWTLLCSRMEQQAYFWLGPSGRAEWARTEAGEIAAKTCADLWHWLQSNPFPFDVPVDRWARRALHNRVYEAVRKQRAYARHIVDSLDRPTSDCGNSYADRFASDDLAHWLETESHRASLQHALARLDMRQARLIRLWYLEGWSPSEIAGALDIKVNHVYVLKHRALNALRKACLCEDAKS